MNSLATLLKTIPINQLSRPCLSHSGLWIGKAGLFLNNRGGEKYYFGGFSINDDREAAERVAQYELLERLLAKWDLHAHHYESMVAGNSPFKAYSLDRQELDYNIEPARLFLGKSPFSDRGVEAAGLSLHRDWDNAITHSVFELIERHICGSLWYEKKWNLRSVSHIHVSDRWNVQTFTVERSLGIPFAIVAVFDEQDSICVFGHAVRSSLWEAQHKAELEAWMLLDGLLAKDSGLCTNQVTKERLLSQKGPKAMDRLRWVRNMLGPEDENVAEQELHQQWKVHEVIERLDGWQENLVIVPIVEGEDFILVRALSRHAKTLANYRRELEQSGGDLLADPFC